MFFFECLEEFEKDFFRPKLNNGNTKWSEPNLKKRTKPIINTFEFFILKMELQFDSREI